MREEDHTGMCTNVHLLHTRQQRVWIKQAWMVS